MLSIRTQDRMALVPYDATIKIDKMSYIVNKKEIEDIHESNAKLYKEFPKNGQSLFSKVVLEEEFKVVRLATPPIVYGIKDYCLILRGVNIGSYTTKEIALEVLDEIEKHYKEQWVDNKTTRYNTFERNLVYQMPKEATNEKTFISYFPNEDDDEYRNVIKPDTLGQYTGLKDKNGVEIYEGDRVRYVHEQDYHYDENLDGYSDEWIESTINWQGDYPAFDIDGHNEEYNLLSSPEIIIEVIGNIHEKEATNEKT